MRSIPRVALTAISALLVSTGLALAAPAEVTNDLNMRTGPGTNYGVITVVPGGDVVDVIDCEGSWCRVRYGGRNGWVSASYLGDTAVASAPRRRVIVEEEPVYVAPPVVVGSPYLYGEPYGYGPRRYYQGQYYGPRYDRRFDRQVYRQNRDYRQNRRVAPGPVYRGGLVTGTVPSYGGGNGPSAQGGGNQFVPGSGGSNTDSIGTR